MPNQSECSLGEIVTEKLTEEGCMWTAPSLLVMKRSSSALGCIFTAPLLVSLYFPWGDLT